MKYTQQRANEDKPNLELIIKESKLATLIIIKSSPYLPPFRQQHILIRMEESLTQSLPINPTIDTSSLPNLPPNLQQDLIQVFGTLRSSLYLLFLHYKPYLMQYENYLKLIILTFLVYVFYKLGGMTVTDRIESEKQQLRAVIERKNLVQQKIPNQIRQINSNTIKLILLIVVLSTAYAYAFYTGHQQKLTEFQNPIIVISILTLCYLIYSNLSKFILSKRLKNINKLQQTYLHKLNHFTTSLGPKVIAILRNHLCRETMIKYSSQKNYNQCFKQNCKELRALLKQKNDAIASLVQDTVDFQWCSICKKKLPFDQHLNFEVLPYQAQTQNQEEQIKNKLGYLIDGLDRIRKWLAETSPCNCSKLYWTTSTKHIIDFKKTDKTIDAKIKETSNKQGNDKI